MYKYIFVRGQAHNFRITQRRESNPLVNVILHVAELNLNLRVEVLGLVQHLVKLIQRERAIPIDVGLLEKFFRLLHHHFLLNGGAVADGKYPLCSLHTKKFVSCYCTSTAKKSISIRAYRALVNITC